MGWIILLILFGTPILEIYVMIEIGDQIGALNTIALILLTAGLGGLLFRFQGLSTLRRVREQVDRNEMPVADMLSGVGILLAALLLFIPGFVTDALGFLLFVPLIRKLLMAAMVARLVARGGFHFSSSGTGGGYAGRRGDIIDGDFEDVSDPADDRERTRDQQDVLPPRQ